jgi:hypothetical protein
MFEHGLLAGYRTYWITASGLIEQPRAIPSYENRDWLFSARPDIPPLR